MTLEQLESLLKRAEDVLGEKFVFDRNAVSGWNLYLASGSGRDDVFAGTLDACVARLKQWATPPKPDMLPVLVPIATAEFAASEEVVHRSECNKHSRIIADSCREALKPYQEQP